MTNSNLKKSLSKSRERLCDMRLTLGKSREYLNNESKLASRSQEKFYNFKSISKSQEVLSQGLGGSMKRINGAVSDISPHHLPVAPRVYLDTVDNCDFVMLPGSSVLMSHSELMSITGLRNSSSLQLLPISESGRSTPASLCSNATVADIPYTETLPCSDAPGAGPGSNKNVVAETLVEVAEEDTDEDDNKNRSGQNNNKESREKATSVTRQLSNNNLVNSRRKSKQETSLPRTCSQKEEKNNINYETKQSLSRSVANNNLDSNNKYKNTARNNNVTTTTSTAEVAIQVDDKDLNNIIPATQPTQAVVRRKEKTEKSDGTKSGKNESTTAAPTTPVFNNIQVDGNIRPGPQEKKLTRGFSHDNTLGEEQKRYSWREDLEKFRSMKKPLAVSDLIDAFSTNSMQRKVSADDPSFPNVDSLKNKRRGSLQIQIDPKSLAKLTETSEISDSLKALRRKSTSAIMPLRLSEVKAVDSDETGDDSGEKKDGSIVRDADDSKYSTENSSEKTVGSSEGRHSVESEDDAGSNESINNTAYLNQSLPKGRVYLEKVNERKRTWDYFEINHPKAISDKKLEQLKAKYTRRKTENDILSKSTKDKNANDKIKSGTKVPAPPVRTQTLAVFEGLEGSPLPKKSLDLAFDLLTGECLSLETESVDSGRESELTRKLSSDSSDEGSSSRKSSKSGRRKSSNLGDILESENIPEEMVLECFIDPFTGRYLVEC